MGVVRSPSCIRPESRESSDFGVSSPLLISSSSVIPVGEWDRSECAGDAGGDLWDGGDGALGSVMNLDLAFACLEAFKCSCRACFLRCLLDIVGAVPS